jgi:hypothetical protein
MTSVSPSRCWNGRRFTLPVDSTAPLSSSSRTRPTPRKMGRRCTITVNPSTGGGAPDSRRAMTTSAIRPIVSPLGARTGSRASRDTNSCSLPAATVHLALKYLASGWWTMIAEVDCSGWSWNSSDSSTPIRSGRSSSNSLVCSSRSGQAG